MSFDSLLILLVVLTCLCLGAVLLEGILYLLCRGFGICLGRSPETRACGGCYHGPERRKPPTDNEGGHPND